MNILDIIAAKRDGQILTPEQIAILVHDAVNGRARDYQIAAWLMAAYIRGLNPAETTALTKEMARSGRELDLSSLPKPWIDKHSTGGVGDKTSIVVLPMLAAAGLTVVKMSGRGLGITGGTIDKLSSVPGFRFDLSPDQLIEQARDIGIALTGQTPDLAPADKVFYALRDSTATVDSIPLIVSSILSKKIAGGSNVIAIDVKCGSGAFMKTLPEARQLADALIETAEACGLKLGVEITDMSQPLGRAVGNALEIEEAISVLKGTEAGRFRELCIGLCALAIQECGRATSHNEALLASGDLLDSGKALLKAKEWFSSQGADPAVFDNPFEVLPRAPVIHCEIYAGPDAWVRSWDAATVGHASVELGAGRIRKEDTIDPSVGILSFIHVGSKIVNGDRLFEVHAKSQESALPVTRQLLNAIELSESPVEEVPLFLS